MKDDKLSLRTRIFELQQQLSSAQASLHNESQKAQNLDVRVAQDQDNLRVMEQANWVLKDEVETQRGHVRSLSHENEGLRIAINSEHYAKPGQMCVRPNLEKRELGIHGNVGFVAMPFSQDWSDSVYGAVARAFQERGMECQRADALVGRNIILDVWTSICECAVIVADITGRNPNVMYELGLAEAVGKRVILISQTTDPREIAFDILGTRLICYSIEDLGSLIVELKKRLRP